MLMEKANCFFFLSQFSISIAFMAVLLNVSMVKTLGMPQVTHLLSGWPLRIQKLLLIELLNLTSLFFLLKLLNKELLLTLRLSLVIETYKILSSRMQFFFL